MLPLWLVLTLAVAAVLGLLYQGVAILFAFEMPRLDPTPPSGPDPAHRRPRVTVVIAARDEEDELPSTLDTLLAQDYPDLEILVVEDGSTDRTREEILARAPRVQCRDPPPLPDGWTGKNWACWTGARAATGEWLLFLDADVRTHPSAVRTAVDWATAQNADLMTLATRVETLGFWERVVLPIFVQLTLTSFRAPHVNRDDSRAAIANGQFWLTPRTTYFELGGHEAVRSIVQEDVALSRRYRAAGRRLRIAWGPELAITRMYRSRSEMFQGLLKNLSGSDYSAPRLLGAWVGLFALFLLPLGLLPFALFFDDLLLVGVGAFFYLALFGKHVLFSRSIGTPAVYGLLYFVGIGFFLALFGVAFERRLLHRTVVWKGRTYPVRH
jgi:chlorobactene glucosyltransferase